MASLLHKFDDGTIWYFREKGTAGMLVEVAKPLAYPTWQIRCAYIGWVVVDVPDELALDMLKLPRTVYQFGQAS